MQKRNYISVNICSYLQGHVLPVHTPCIEVHPFAVCLLHQENLKEAKNAEASWALASSSLQNERSHMQYWMCCCFAIEFSEEQGRIAPQWAFFFRDLIIKRDSQKVLPSPFPTKLPPGYHREALRQASRLNPGFVHNQGRGKIMLHNLIYKLLQYMR